MKSAVTAIVPAAGKSRRMGRPKPLLPVDGRPAIDCCLAALAIGGAGPVVVVVRQGDTVLAERLQGHPGVVVCHAPPVGGDMAASVRQGLGVLTEAVTGVLILPADHPLVRPDTVARLIARHRQVPDRIVVPRFRHRLGHPPLFPLPLLAELDRAGSHLRRIMADHADRLDPLDTDDEGVVLDMDTPADYHRLCQRAGRRQGSAGRLRKKPA